MLRKKNFPWVKWGLRSITRNLSSIGASVHRKRAILKSQLAPITFIFSEKKRFSVSIKIPKYEQDRSTNTRDSCFPTRSTFPANCNLKTSRLLQFSSFFKLIHPYFHESKRFLPIFRFSNSKGPISLVDSS